MAAGGTRKPARGSGDDADGTPAAPRSWKDAWPFLVALGVIVVAVVGLGLSYLLRPAEERVTDSTRVQYAINDYYTARNASDYTAYREHTCAADLASPSFITEQVFSEQNRDRRDNPIQIDITDLTVDGDRAQAQVHWHLKNSSDQKHTVPTVVVRENGEWKVCTS